MIEARPRSRTNKLWICRSCRRGTLGESACEYCAAPRSADAAPTAPEPKPKREPVAPVAASPSPKERRVRPRLLIAVLLVAALFGGGLFIKSHLGSSTPSSVASAAPSYVPPPRHLPAPGPVTLPAALTAVPGAGDLISPAGATAVVQAAWDLHHQALANHDVSLLAAFETGPALEVDAARDSSGDPFGPASQVVVSVPHQTSYPARFFAQLALTAKGQPWIAFLVFTRADPQAPWMLDVMGAYAAAPTEIASPAVDAGGFLASAPARPVVDPTTVHGLLAEYWRSSTDNGKVPPAPLWAPGAWTTQLATQLARQRQGAVADNGLVGSYAYQAASSASAYAFSEAQGWQIVCSAIYIQKTFRSTADKQVFQDAAQRRWGKSVPPGSHHEVTQNSIAVPCIEVPPAGSGQKVRVKGAQPFADVTTYK